MKHPAKEEMMEHLYGENSPEQRKAIENHLRSCPECAGQTRNWQNAMSALDGWKLPERSRGRILPALRWAAAAAIVLGIGVLAGRSTGPDQAGLQAAIRHEVSTQLSAVMELERATLASELRAAALQTAGDETQRILTAFANRIDERRQSDAEVFYTAIQQVDARHSEEVARLRQDLGTVAVVADARLSEAQDKILQLANASSINPLK